MNNFFSWISFINSFVRPTTKFKCFKKATIHRKIQLNKKKSLVLIKIELDLDQLLFLDNLFLFLLKKNFYFYLNNGKKDEKHHKISLYFYLTCTWITTPIERRYAWIRCTWLSLERFKENCCSIHAGAVYILFMSCPYILNVYNFYYLSILLFSIIFIYLSQSSSEKRIFEGNIYFNVKNNKKRILKVVQCWNQTMRSVIYTFTYFVLCL